MQPSARHAAGGSLSPFVEEGRGRPRALWRLFAQFALLVFATSFFTGLLELAWLFLGPGGAALDGPETGRAAGIAADGAPASLALVGAFASLLAVLLSVWLAGRFLDRRPFADFGFHLGGGWWLDLLFGLALGALLMTAVFLVELGFGWVEIADGRGAGGTTGRAGLSLALLVPLARFVCVGVSEELLSRGYQIRNVAEGLANPSLGHRGAVVVAWLLTSVFFGLLHLGNPNVTALATANIAITGLTFGLAYVLTGELAIPIGLHTAWNFFQGNVFGFPVSGTEPVGANVLGVEQSGPALWTGGAFGPEGGLLVPAAMIAGAGLIVLWVRLRTGKTSIHTPIAGGPSRPRPDHR